MPAFEWVHVQLHQQKGMISLSPPTICNSAVPFAALIKADECIISKIASYSGFAVTAFLRIKDQDIATNILNREGIFAFNGCERRFRHPVSEDNWQQVISEERAIRCAKRLIQCKG
ncbi:hypothetical protein AX175_24055 [Salmonella enterica subsp. enterica serovar Dublin]|nr:hypothetical protein [Salmonella enterica subsp. enterica serovar Dublin]